MLKRIHLAGALAMVVALALVSSVDAQSKAKQPASTLSDHFLPHVLEMNAAEVEFARIAMEKSQNPRVRDFAQMVYNVHSETVENLGGLYYAGAPTKLTSVSKERMYEMTREKPTTHKSYSDVSTWLTPEHRLTQERLSRLSGPAFDREFISVMVHGHKKGLKFVKAHAVQFDKERDSVHNSFAMLCRALEPHLLEHLKEAEAIQRELPNTNQ